MLIEFTVENWKTFREPAAFSMVASRERQHKERLAKIEGIKERILQTAAIFGGNAAGKSNFVSAISFAREFIVNGPGRNERIPVAPFALDKTALASPVKFRFLLLLERKTETGEPVELTYEYSFSVTSTEVVEESLVEYGLNGPETLFFRKQNEFGGALLSDGARPEEERQRMRSVSMGTKPCQLLLTNAISQGIESLGPISNWFANSLTIIGPETKYTRIERYFKTGDPLKDQGSRLLSRLDAGIIELKTFESEVPGDFPKGLDISEGEISPDPSGLSFITREKGKLVRKSLGTLHINPDQELFELDLSAESDGVQRVFHLLPAFADLAAPQSRAVVIIDELDRSLHSLLTEGLLELYLDSSSSSTRSQLIFTSHDTELMTQHLLRRDEIWLAERPSYNETVMYSLSEYKAMRSDKDIRKSYLRGNYGGIPFTLPLILDV